MLFLFFFQSFGWIDLKRKRELFFSVHCWWAFLPLISTHFVSGLESIGIHINYKLKRNMHQEIGGTFNHQCYMCIMGREERKSIFFLLLFLPILWYWVEACELAYDSSNQIWFFSIQIDSNSYLILESNQWTDTISVLQNWWGEREKERWMKLSKGIGVTECVCVWMMMNKFDDGKK